LHEEQSETIAVSGGRMFCWNFEFVMLFELEIVRVWECGVDLSDIEIEKEEFLAFVDEN
jgi:hypothetical protein